MECILKSSPKLGEVPKGRRGLWYWGNSYIVTIIFKSTDFTQTVTLLHAFPLYRYGRTARTSSIHRNVPAERSINQGRTLSFANKAFVRFEQFVFQKIRQ